MQHHVTSRRTSRETSRHTSRRIASLAALALLAAALAGCLSDADWANWPGEARSAPQASDTGDCQWLRSTTLLEARLSLDYQGQASTPAGARLQLLHSADVHGDLRLLQRDERGAVWSGALSRGRMLLQDSLTPAGGGTALALVGRGTPKAGAALAGTLVTLRVDFSDCSLQYAARLAVPASARGDGAATARPWQEMGRLSVSGLSATRGPLLAGAWRVPAGRPPVADEAQALRVQDRDETVSLGWYQPAGLAARADAAQPGGEALLRWRFKARG